MPGRRPGLIGRHSLATSLLSAAAWVTRPSPIRLSGSCSAHRACSAPGSWTHRSTARSARRAGAASSLSWRQPAYGVRTLCRRGAAGRFAPGVGNTRRRWTCLAAPDATRARCAKSCTPSSTEDIGCWRSPLARACARRGGICSTARMPSCPSRCTRGGSFDAGSIRRTTWLENSACRCGARWRARGSAVPRPASARSTGTEMSSPRSGWGGARRVHGAGG